MLQSMTIPYRSANFKGPRKHMGGPMSLHTVGGILALCAETGRTRIDLIESFIIDGMKRLHPEWYENGYMHPIELEAEAEEAARVAETAARVKVETEARRQAAEAARRDASRAA